MNWEERILVVVLTVSKGLNRTETPRALASSMSPELRAKPPVITSPRTPCSMAGNCIVGLSPQTTRTRSLSNFCILSVKPSELIAPTMTRSSSLRWGSTSCWKEPPRASVIFFRFVVTVRDLIGSPSSRNRSSIKSRTDRTPLTRFSVSTTGIARRSHSCMRRYASKKASPKDAVMVSFRQTSSISGRTSIIIFGGAVFAVLRTYSVRLLGGPQQAASASGFPVWRRRSA